MVINMWRKATIETKIRVLMSKKENLEEGLLECIRLEKDRRFATEAADYLVMYCLLETSMDYYSSIDNRFKVNCGLIGEVNIQELVRIKGLLVGLSVLVMRCFKNAREIGCSDNIKQNMFGNAMKKTWATLRENESTISKMDEDKSKLISNVLFNIGISIVESSLRDPKLDLDMLFNKIIENHDMLTLFLGFMSFDDMLFDIKESRSGNKTIHMLSRVVFTSKNEINLKDKYGEILSDVHSVIRVFDYSEYSLNFSPNEKYFFFGTLQIHRDSCFSTLNVINKLLHRCLNNMVKVNTKEDK